MQTEKLIFKTSSGIFEVINDTIKLNTLIRFLPIEAGLTLNDLIKVKK